MSYSKIENVSFQNATIRDTFWRPKIEINRVTGIRHALQQASNSIASFDIAAGKRKFLDTAIRFADCIDAEFGPDCLLPNDRAYCETCSGIGFIYWNRRMCLMHGNAKYADLTELTMCNTALAGISLSGDRFFYINCFGSINPCIIGRLCK